VSAGDPMRVLAAGRANLLWFLPIRLPSVGGERR
jgi:hypothetical protein